jgi:protein disulfide-isomerase A1
MDGTENEHPDVEVKGYPTLIFYPAEKNAKPIAFDGGDRSLKAMTKFIKKHAKIAYELAKKEKKEGDDAEKDGDKEDDEDVKDEL